MAQATPKITLSVSRDIPFNKLLLSDSNVRRTKPGVAIEQLADDIARRTLLQSLTVRPVLDADGAETGMYEIPAGGRRYRALELLVKQKRLAKTAPIPCVIRMDGLAEEDSLAENVQRAPLHPLDQFRAFLALRENGQSEEEIAATFFVSVTVVKQRLRLAAVSPRLLDAYAADAISLDQLMAFTVSGDNERQDQVWDRLQSAYSKEPHVIRRMLTEGAVRASDKRAQFIGIETFEAAGGIVLRDLFQGDGGGWLQDVVLVDRLVAGTPMANCTSSAATSAPRTNCRSSRNRNPSRRRTPRRRRTVRGRQPPSLRPVLHTHRAPNRIGLRPGASHPTTHPVKGRSTPSRTRRRSRRRTRTASSRCPTG
jgi:ParB family chromosome partitioning protein